MAYTTRWQIPFCSMNGTRYNINIQQDGWSGAVTTLVGSESPIETAEDDDTDLTKPVRTQTGYIRIVCDDNSWTQLVPDHNMQNKVVLEKVNADNTTTTEWQGWMKAEGYDHSLWQYMDEYEFPIVSSIGALEFCYLRPTGVMLEHNLPIEVLLKKLLNEAKCTYTTLHFPANVNKNFALTTLCINQTIWFEHNNNWSYGGNVYDHLRASKSCLEILESVCTIMGWTARESGQELFFTSSDNFGYKYRHIDWSAFGEAGSTTAYDTDASVPATLSLTEYADADTSVKMNKSYKSIEVKSSVDKAETILELPKNDEFDKFTDIAHTSGIFLSNVLQRYLTTGNTTHTFSDVTLDTKATTKVNVGTINTTNIGSDEATSSIYPAVRILENSDFNTYIFAIKTNKPLYFRGGYLTLNADIVFDNKSNSNSGGINAQLSVGGKTFYIEGDTDKWGTGMSFNIPITGSDYNRKIASRTTYSELYHQGEGFIIDLCNRTSSYGQNEYTEYALSGIVELKLASPKKCYIKNLKLTYNLPVDDRIFKDGNVDITKDLDGNASEDKTIQPDLCSSQNKYFGNNILFYDGGGAVSKIEYNNTPGVDDDHAVTTKIPEQHLVDIFAPQLEVAQRFITVNVKDTNKPTSLLQAVSTGDTNFGNCQIIAVGRNWVDDEVKLTLHEYQQQTT